MQTCPLYFSSETWAQMLPTAIRPHWPTFQNLISINVSGAELVDGTRLLGVALGHLPSVCQARALEAWQLAVGCSKTCDNQKLQLDDCLCPVSGWVSPLTAARHCEAGARHSLTVTSRAGLGNFTLSAQCRVTECSDQKLFEDFFKKYFFIFNYLHIFDRLNLNFKN